VDDRGQGLDDGVAQRFWPAAHVARQTAVAGALVRRDSGMNCSHVVDDVAQRVWPAAHVAKQAAVAGAVAATRG
ncbi:MAG: hypothetical protein KC636_16605, partial [Myxococcales bacterium]|nr:hypothetical protein [Myxococcales bacterium]